MEKTQKKLIAAAGMAAAVLTGVILFAANWDKLFKETGASPGNTSELSSETEDSETIAGTEDSEIIAGTEGIDGTETTEAGQETEKDSTIVDVAPNLPDDPNPEMYSSVSGYTIYDPRNTRGLSTEKKDYGFGYTTNGQPHSMSIGNQQYFDSLDGVNAMALDLVTTEKVLYLTFDCGYEYNGNTAKIVDILKEKDVPAAFFGLLSFYKKNPELTARMIEDGHILGNHTATHACCPNLSRDEMASEIYLLNKYLLDTYGYDCNYFRFPSGEYSECGLELASSIGQRVSFWSVAYRDWDVNALVGYEEAFNTLTGRLHPGAVIMLHAVSDDNVAIMADFIDYARAQGYTFVSLDDYSWKR